MIDNSIHLPILHRNFFEDEDDKTYIKILNKEIDRLIDLNDDCWGRLDTKDDTWCSYRINKDILFNNDIFEAVSYKLKDAILQYTMGVRSDTQRHQVHLVDSCVFSSRSNPYPDFKSDDSQHFRGILFLQAEKTAGNVIIKNPFIPPRIKFHHTGDGPFREYFVSSNKTGDLMIFPSHVEWRMADFTNDDGSKDLRFVTFNVTVA